MAQIFITGSSAGPLTLVLWCGCIFCPPCQQAMGQPAGPCHNPPPAPPTVVDLISLRIGACASLLVAYCCLPPPPVIGAGCRKGLGVKTVALLMMLWWWDVARQQGLCIGDELQVVRDVVQNGLRTSRHPKDLPAKIEHPFIRVLDLPESYQVIKTFPSLRCMILQLMLVKWL